MRKMMNPYIAFLQYHRHIAIAATIFFTTHSIINMAMSAISINSIGILDVIHNKRSRSEIAL